MISKCFKQNTRELYGILNWTATFLSVFSMCFTLHSPINKEQLYKNNGRSLLNSKLENFQSKNSKALARIRNTQETVYYSTEHAERDFLNATVCLVITPSSQLPFLDETLFKYYFFWRNLADISLMGNLGEMALNIWQNSTIVYTKTI